MNYQEMSKQELIQELQRLQAQIEESHHLEQELVHKTALLSGLLDSIPDIIFFKNLDGVYLGCNLEFAKLINRDINLIVGYTDYDFFDKDLADFFRDRDHDMLASGASRQNDEWIEYPDGRRVLIDTLKAPLKTQTGEIIGLVGVSRDITQRKSEEEELRRARIEADEANLAKTEFLSRMSHELRTPMNSILGFAQLLSMGSLNSTQTTGVTHILKSGDHLLRLINEVLDISRIDTGHISLIFEPVSLNKAVPEMIDVVQPLSEWRSVYITYHPVSEEAACVVADLQRLKQVLLNLINNAIKYNKEGGTVNITVKPNEEKKTTRIEVEDTGFGIAPENLEKLFRPFERIGAEKSNTEGTGLGLAVVKKLMEAMKGSFGVESKVGIGSCFWIELPQNTYTANEQTPIESVVMEPAAFEAQSGHILYVEDNWANIDLVREILSFYRPSLQLSVRMRGEEAVEAVDLLNPDLILLDLNLPDMHGSEILHSLKEDAQKKHIPIIIVSADAMPLQREKMIQAGALDYLSKPLNVKLFLSVIDKVLEGVS